MLLAAARGRLRAELTPRSFPSAAVAIVLATEGYPDAPRRGDTIVGLDDAVRNGALVFHAATSRDPDGTWRTNGGRVLAVVGQGTDIEAARHHATRADRKSVV